MAFWLVFWQIFFVVVLVGFAFMSVWVTIGGYKDIRKLFARLDKQHEDKKG